MTDAQLSLFAGALLSLAFSYVPRLKEWFEEKDSTTKRLIMAGALLVVSLALFASACTDILPALPIVLTVTCDKNGAVQLASYFVLALIANQATYTISPKPEAPDDLEDFPRAT
jgi:hypothetical protein